MAHWLKITGIWIQWLRASQKVPALISREVKGPWIHEADWQIRERKSGMASGACAYWVGVM